MAQNHLEQFPSKIQETKNDAAQILDLRLYRAITRGLGRNAFLRGSIIMSLNFGSAQKRTPTDP
jgi:hypothetical protein